jgi:hypothetical protein
MKESSDEGWAAHIGSESCTTVREGGGEALTGVRAGRVIEPRKGEVRGADAVSQAEGNTGGAALARLHPTPRGLRPRACTKASRAGSGRSHVWPGVGGRPVRDANPKGARPR